MTKLKLYKRSPQQNTEGYIILKAPSEDSLKQISLCWDGGGGSPSRFMFKAP